MLTQSGTVASEHQEDILAAVKASNDALQKRFGLAAIGTAWIAGPEGADGLSPAGFTACKDMKLGDASGLVRTLVAAANNIAEQLI